jgi:hypothetical protein
LVWGLERGNGRGIIVRNEVVIMIRIEVLRLLSLREEAFSEGEGRGGEGYQGLG